MSAAALDRQIRPIYDALDTGSNKSALVGCNKLLKKYPQHDLLKALKALALVRSQKVEESLALCDEVLESKPTTDAVLTAMMHVLRGLGRQKDMVTMFDDAYKQQPNNEELGAQTFFANVRATNWKTAQQIATKMHKQFQDSRYLYWTVMCTVLQAKDPSTSPDMRSLLYKLAHRLLESSSTPSFLSAERFYLHLSVLRELQMLEEAQKLVDSDIGRAICSASLVCNQMRRQVWKLQGRILDEGQRAESRIVENDRNWLEFVSVIDAVFAPFASTSDPNEEGRNNCAKAVKKVEELFSKVADEDGTRDRSGLLGLLELEKQAIHYGMSSGSSRLLYLMQQYFEKFGDKACCFEDLKPYQILAGEDSTKWTSFLESVPENFSSAEELRRLINSYKLLRCKLLAPDVTVEAESGRATLYTKHYLLGLQIGLNLPSSELQPADDLAILAGHSFVMLWTLTNDEGYLFRATSLLEFVLTKSTQSFQSRLILIRLYRLLGAPSLALEHYRALHVKQIQHDTLSHLILSRASTFSLSSTGDLTLASECLEATQIYLSNSQETGDYIVRAFTTEKYSQIPEFFAFEERLDNSLQRDIIKMEHLRMRLTHELISSDVVDMELIELKFIFDRTHHDNRDFTILPNYQPQSVISLNEQTLFLQRQLGNGWLIAFLRLYITVLQQASDLDDMVEDKLLIGDRPKQSSDPGKQLPLRDRLQIQSPDEPDQLTADERSLLEYTLSMAEWLEPYHNYTRPPPHVVLAEAAKQTELKTGHPLKGIEVQALNGSPNDNGKKNEEPPSIREAPAIVANHFKDVKEKIFVAFDNMTVIELLHRATLAQEAFILFVVETLRFKSTSVVKVNKLGPLVASFKAIKTDGLALLKDISASLVEKSEKYNSAENRKAFMSACSELVAADEIGHDFVQTVGRKICESRKKVLEGHFVYQTYQYNSENAVTLKCDASMSQYADYGNNPYYSGGGGYLQGASPFGASPGGGRRSETSHSLRPVVIAQLIKATQPHADAEWTIEGAEIGQVTLVAHVVSVQVQTTNKIIWLDDGTGRVEARCWVDSTTDDETDKWASIEENTYARVTGSLKSFANKRYINALHIRSIKDPHEIYYHILETINASLVLERGQAPGPGQQHANAHEAIKGASAYNAQSYTNSGMEQFSHLPPLEKAIVNFIIDNVTGEEGVHVAAILRGLGAGREKIDGAIEKLLDEGHIFTTLDESHFNVSR
ncbi:hypothetical protein APHAL10511_001116 [Amanita phalloides]|nr:hypothetical protein APHAL10511_001116 [Amanita phalloides]